MSTITDVPAFHRLMNPTLAALQKLGGSASIDELVTQVVRDLQLPPDVVEKPHKNGNQTSLEYRLAWARTYLKNYGLITNSARGVWALTPEGTKVREVDPKAVVRYVRERTRGQSSGKASPTGGGAAGPPGGDDESSPEQPWREALAGILRTMPPDAFERLCQRLLRESGFIEVEVTGRSGDGGIDGHGIIRVAGLISFPVIFQSKRYSDNIGASVVRDFRGAMIGRAEKGLLITTGGFTREAKAEATRDGAPPIDLIDGELLMDKLKELGLGVRSRMVERVEVDEDWFASL